METIPNNSAAEIQNNEFKTGLKKCHNGAENWLMLCAQNNNPDTNKLLQANYLANILRNVTIIEKENAYKKACTQTRNAVEVIPPINK